MCHGVDRCNKGIKGDLGSEIFFEVLECCC